MSTLPLCSDEDNPEVVIISITKGQHVLVDPEDADLAEMKWSLNGDFYAIRRPRIDGKRPCILMHRVILERKLGRPILHNMVVDHVNGDGLNNRRINLREVTYKQNALNRMGRRVKHIVPDAPAIKYRLDENNPAIALIPLNQGKSAQLDIIDIDLAELRWTLNCSRYANRRIEKNGQGKHVSMHRVVLERKLGRSITAGMVVDHINGDGLDNRRENLREATQAQNLRNTRLRSDSASRYKGITPIVPNTWKAFINEQLIGYFDTAQDASLAYDKAALALYGEFACLNNSPEQVLEWTPPVRQFGRKSASGYRGVRICGSRWGARIKDDKQELALGFFDTAEEAAFAYDKVALEMYGESARLNHPIEQVLAWIPPVRLLRKTNTSGYRGVKKSRKRWSADIHTGGQYLHLGMFDAPEEAAKAYDKAALEVFGARALLNFPVQKPDDGLDKNLT